MNTNTNEVVTNMLNVFADHITARVMATVEAKIDAVIKLKYQDVEDVVESAINDCDLDSKVSDALDNIDWDDKINYDIMASNVEDLIEIDDKVNELVDQRLKVILSKAKISINTESI